jgi:spore coat protein U-like protein
VRCPPNIPYTIGVDDGLHPQGNVNRRVKHTTLNDFLRYDIYQNPPRTKVWGKGNAQLLSGNSGLLGLGIHTVYGRLSAKTSMRAGGYQDSVVVEVTF